MLTAERGFRSLFKLQRREDRTGEWHAGPVSLLREAAGANLPCLSQAPVEYAAMIYGQLRRIRLFRLTAKKGEPRWRRRGFLFYEAKRADPRCGNPLSSS
jgi:hypothetical protein